DLPNARLVVIGHCGHAPHEECPGEVIAALKEFTQKIDDHVSSPDSLDDARTNIEPS
ncbi:MAG: hypothetical protein QOJ58_2716, partial [Alphaproteobacteria bacterium]|nr:hypothetical protein [Alphaproteobacteria bacterium]